MRSVCTGLFQAFIKKRRGRTGTEVASAQRPRPRAWLDWSGSAPTLRNLDPESAMLAIPSPDVLVNLFASAAQVLGLAALCVGGGLAAKKRLPGARAGAGVPSSRLPLTFALLGLFGLG